MHLELDEQICCAMYKAGEIDVKASLLVRRQGAEQHFRVKLEHGGECAVCELGTQSLVAKSLFFDVVFGGVTACTLEDVVEDRMGTLFL